MKGDRRTYLKSIGTLGLAGLAGCMGSFGGGSGGAAANIGMVYAKGGLGDKSFNDMAQRGVKDAKEEYDIAFQERQPESDPDFKPAQRRFAESTDPEYDLVCCIGFAQTKALEANAKDYPDQNFMLVDSVVESDNVANYVFKEHQGSFQVGYMAGLLTNQEFETSKAATKSGESKVGFVGGVEAPLIKKFEAGYKKGVEHAGNDVSVSSTYVGDFADPTGGKEAALSMYEDGADIVYHAAGATGLGVFQAAKEKGRYAIGVDADQSESEADFKDYILASMVKRVDEAVLTAVGNVVDDNYKGGDVVTLGLDKNGVEAVYGQTLGSEIPQGVKDKLKTSREEIIAGDISVPTEP
ncbi:BMP family lipoprotein [Haloarchaeobius sp. DFWS5]|uniref:BMP family lipoprotein n=1 Tax=Haloarchaeobius sp. DFWS5 TaxID=3446114 RepID=UPI003EBAC812